MTKQIESIYQQTNEPVHLWFSLSYCSYLVWPRSIMQSMPLEWQRKFTELAEEIDAAAEKVGIETPNYTVYARNGSGRFITDEYRDYQRGRRNVFKEPV
jgi:hypothetical protein